MKNEPAPKTNIPNQEVPQEKNNIILEKEDIGESKAEVMEKVLENMLSQTVINRDKGLALDNYIDSPTPENKQAAYTELGKRNPAIVEYKRMIELLESLSQNKSSEHTRESIKNNVISEARKFIPEEYQDVITDDEIISTLNESALDNKINHPNLENLKKPYKKLEEDETISENKPEVKKLLKEIIKNIPRTKIPENTYESLRSHIIAEARKFIPENYQEKITDDEILEALADYFDKVTIYPKKDTIGN